MGEQIDKLDLRMMTVGQLSDQVDEEVRRKKNR